MPPPRYWKASTMPTARSVRYTGNSRDALTMSSYTVSFSLKWSHEICWTLHVAILQGDFIGEGGGCGEKKKSLWFWNVVFQFRNRLLGDCNPCKTFCRCVYANQSSKHSDVNFLLKARGFLFFGILSLPRLEIWIPSPVGPCENSVKSFIQKLGDQRTHGLLTRHILEFLFVCHSC